MMYPVMSLPWEKPGYVAPEGTLVSKNDEWEIRVTRDYWVGASSFAVRPAGEGWERTAPYDKDMHSFWRRRVK